jgi:uncharacterized protein
MARLLVALLSVPIRAYRLVISPVMPHACRFSPSCSVYALDALRLHGPARGSWLALKRLARCHPISWLGGSSGLDPVPLSKNQHP